MARIVILTVFYVAVSMPVVAQTAIINQSTDKEKFEGRIRELLRKGNIEKLFYYLDDYERRNKALIEVGDNSFVSPREYCYRILVNEGVSNGELKRYLAGTSSSLVEDVSDDNWENAYNYLGTVPEFSDLSGKARILIGRRLIESGNLEEASIILAPLISDEKLHESRTVAQFLYFVYMASGEQRIADSFRSHMEKYHAVRPGEISGISAFSGAAQPDMPKVSLHRLEPVPVMTYRYLGTFNTYFRMNSSISFDNFLSVCKGAVIAINTENSLSVYLPYGTRLEKVWSYDAPVMTQEYDYEERLFLKPRIDGGDIYACITSDVSEGEVKEGYVRTIYPFPRRALHQFDLSTGRLNWKIGGKANSSNFEGNLTFNTRPLVHRGMLVTGAVFQKKPQDPFFHYLLFIDKKSGEILKKTFVVSGTTQINLFGNSIRESLPSEVIITPHGYFYDTNIGVVAMAGFDGKLKWVYRYQEHPQRPSRELNPLRKLSTWQYNDPWYYGGRVYVTPLDSDYLYCFNSSDGSLEFKLVRNDSRFFYGIADNKIIVSGSEVGFYDAMNGSLIKRIALRNDIESTGRGFIHKGLLYIPLIGEVLVINCSSLAIEGYLSADGISGGNLFFDGNLLLNTTNDKIDIFVASYSGKKYADTDHEAIELLLNEDVESVISLLDRKRSTALSDLSLISSLRNLLNIYLIEKCIQERKYQKAVGLIDSVRKKDPGIMHQRLLELQLTVYDKLVMKREVLATLTDLLYISRNDIQKWQVYKKSLRDFLNAYGMEHYSQQEKKANELLAAVKERTWGSFHEKKERLMEIYKVYPYTDSAAEALKSYADVSLSEAVYDDALHALLIVKSLEKGWNLESYMLLARVLKGTGNNRALYELNREVRGFNPSNEEEEKLKQKILADYDAGPSIRFPLSLKTIQMPRVDFVYDTGEEKSEDILLFTQSGMTIVFEVKSGARLDTLNFVGRQFCRYGNKIIIFGYSSIAFYDLETKEFRSDVINFTSGYIYFTRGIGRYFVILVQRFSSSEYQLLTYDIEQSRTLVSKSYLKPVRFIAYNRFFLTLVQGNRLYYNSLGSVAMKEIGLSSDEEVISLHIPGLTGEQLLVETDSQIISYDLLSDEIMWTLDITVKSLKFGLESVWISTGQYVYEVDLLTGKRLTRYSPASGDVVDFAVISNNVFLLDKNGVIHRVSGSDSEKVIQLPEAVHKASLEAHFDYLYVDVSGEENRKQLLVYDIEGMLLQAIPSDSSMFTLNIFDLKNRIVCFGLYNKVHTLQIYD